MLTDTAIKALKSGPKDIKKSDGGGLFLLVSRKGSKLWRFAYRYDGKQKLLAGGSYPEVSLANARKWRDEARSQLAAGQDPGVVRKEAKRAAKMAQENSFEEVARNWLAARDASWTPRYAALVKGRLEADIFPLIGSRNIATIDPPNLLDAIRTIERRGSVEMAHRVKNHCGEIFRYAIAEEKCRSDPSRDIGAAMKRPAPVQHRAKIEARQLPAFFAKLNQDQGERLSHLALRWTILTMVRTQETRFAQWSEFEGLDTGEPLWRIPPARMKMRTEHLVPLPPQAIDLLAEIRKTNPFRDGINAKLRNYLFPVSSSRTWTISENRMLDIMYRMGLRGKATVHGFRGLASTVLNEAGDFAPDWIELQLAHVPRGVRAACNSARYLPHRRRMMVWWADYLDEAQREGAILTADQVLRVFSPDTSSTE
jgi:integrase